MELHYLNIIFTIFILLSLFPQYLHCQQQFLNETVFDCSSNPSTPKGYLCNSPKKSCTSFLVYRSKPPYNTPQTIANLLGSEESTVSSINKISSNNKIPTNKSIIVPVSCSCSGNIYQHNAFYTVNKDDTYFMLVNTTYQGLTTCQALMGQNYYASVNIAIGAQLTVPMLCACPTANQTAKGVTSLLIYSLGEGDTIKSIGESYGVDEQSILDANELNQTSNGNRSLNLMARTPILIPLRGRSCKDDPESFYCTCSQGDVTNSSLMGVKCEESDGQKFPAKLVAALGVGIGAGFLCLFLLGYKLYQCIQKKSEKLHKEKLFKQNGGYLLQEKVSSYANGQRTKLFTAEELKRATDNYNQSRFLGQGGFGTVYKGMLPDGTIVAVKRSKEMERNQIQTFVNEVVILSQINHRNIVKLLGCCLETEAPLLVYEFIPNGTLSDHIHVKEDESSSLSWDGRLRIACEVAGAVAYMHSAASVPIFHRDIKPSNILIDSNYSAKVSDFGTSKSLPLDNTHLTTAVRGTFGYIDPEYFQSNQYTDRSDVYSFGVVLVELITGRRPLSLLEDEGQNLIAEFISLMKENQLSEVLDAKVLKEAREDHILAIANLAMRCLRLSGKKRPTMKEVSAELEALRTAQSSVLIDLDRISPEDGGSLNHTTRGPIQESGEESILLSLQMESTSF